MYMYNQSKQEEILKNLKMFLFNSNLSTSRVFTEIEKVISTLDQEKLNTAYTAYEESVNTHNNKCITIARENIQIKKDLLEFIDSHPMIDRINVNRKRSKGKRGEMYAHWNKVILDLQNYVPHKMALRSKDSLFDFTYEYGGKSYIIHNITITTFFERVLRDIKNVNKILEEGNIKYNKALTYISDNNLDASDCVLANDYIALCDEHARDVYRDSLEGEEIDVTHGDGDDCVWEIGEHRCECGNNRYYLEVEGDFINGFYSYGQWC